MSPSLYSNDDKDNVNFEEHPLIYYWYCRFRNELHLIPGVNATLSMALHRKVDNWPAKEYFFDRLNDEEQVDCARSLIRENGSTFQKAILTKLNEIQRTELYMHDSVYIMDNYSKSSDNYGDSVSTWIELRNSITADQFLSIFVNMLNNDVDNDTLFIMFSDMNPETRKEIIEKEIFVNFCKKLLTNWKLSVLDRMLRLCFSKSDEFAKYKQNLVINSVSVEDTCLSFYTSGDLKKLNDLLTSLLSDKRVVLEYKKNLLLSTRGVSKCTTHLLPNDKNDVLNKIIADSLPTEELAKEFRKRLVLSDSGIGKLRHEIELVQMNAVNKLIDSCLESTQDKTTLKKRLLDNMETLTKIIITYDWDQWNSLLEMFFENDEAVEEFKTTINLDSLFDQVLKYCVFRKYDDRHRLSRCTFIQTAKFDPVDTLLKWFFSSPTKINVYKTKRAFSWMDIEMITTLLKKKDPKYLKAVMVWFFKDNKKAVPKFKKKFADHRIVEML